MRYLTLVPPGFHWIVQREFPEAVWINPEPVPREIAKQTAPYGCQHVGKHPWNYGYYTDAEKREKVPVYTTDGGRMRWMALNGPPSRRLGSWLFLVDSWQRTEEQAETWDKLGPKGTLEDSIEALKGLMGPKYNQSFQEALDLWFGEVQSAWDDPPYSLDDIAYRISFVRHDSSRYSYKRHEWCAEAAECLVPHPPDQWKVRLQGYDLEVVVLQQPDALAIALNLLPYGRLGTKDFSAGLPPDINPPYLPQLSGLVRLRPANAQLLLRLADVQPGDVVLDPCVGIGTIPLECIHLPSNVYGLGGDVVLTTEQLGPIAAQYASESHVFRQTATATDSMAWDAALLPLRSQFVDVVLSDLPFGQVCLSASKLAQQLPLWVAEWTRVLVPSTGRLIILCGNTKPLLKALKETGAYVLPPEAVFPVNIGGLIAWVVYVVRNDNVEGTKVENHRLRAQRVAATRDRLAELNKNGKIGKKRRLQS